MTMLRLVFVLCLIACLVQAAETVDSGECANSNDGTCAAGAGAATTSAPPTEQKEADWWGDLKKQIFGNDNDTQQEEKAATKKVPNFGSLEEDHKTNAAVKKDKSESIWELLQFGTTTKKAKEDHAMDSAWEKIMILANSKAQLGNQKALAVEEKFTILMEFFEKVRGQFSKAFTGLDAIPFDWLQTYYFLQHEAIIKNPTWKSRQHRFLEQVRLDQALALSDALYIASAANADTCEMIDGYLQAFHHHEWLMMNCSLDATPSKPAHFLAVRRHQPQAEPSNGFPMPWKSSSIESVLEVAFVVRATKDLNDMLTDALLESVPYQGGRAHNGIQSSADWLYEQYKDFLPQLLKTSKRDKLKLWTVGYSLGAGAAALLTINFNQDKNTNDTIVSHSLGFGTPAVVTRELSESVKSTVTTVINDADCISRMSGPGLYNAIRRGASYNYTNDALEDLEQLVPFLRANLPYGDTILSEDTIASVRSDLVRSIQQNDNKHNQTAVDDLLATTQTVELFPPGECIHLFRDNLGFQGYFTPCHRFDEIEAVRTMVDDHLLTSDTGYYPTLLNFIRQLKGDWNWRFEYDLMDLAHTKHKKNF